MSENALVCPRCFASYDELRRLAETRVAHATVTERAERLATETTLRQELVAYRDAVKASETRNDTLRERCKMLEHQMNMVSDQAADLRAKLLRHAPVGHADLR
jgi:predicted DsbA family dithiol-disulfide isomerase